VSCAEKFFRIDPGAVRRTGGGAPLFGQGSGQAFSVGARTLFCTDRGIAGPGHERRRPESRGDTAPAALDSYGGGWGDGAGHRRFLAVGGPAAAPELDGIASGRPRSGLQTPSLTRWTTAQRHSHCALIAVKCGSWP
jgi:hypothetical protein